MGPSEMPPSGEAEAFSFKEIVTPSRLGCSAVALLLHQNIEENASNSAYAHHPNPRSRLTCSKKGPYAWVQQSHYIEAKARTFALSLPAYSLSRSAHKVAI